MEPIATIVKLYRKHFPARRCLSSDSRKYLRELYVNRNTDGCIKPECREKELCDMTNLALRANLGYIKTNIEDILDPKNAVQEEPGCFPENVPVYITTCPHHKKLAALVLKQLYDDMIAIAKERGEAA